MSFSKLIKALKETKTAEETRPLIINRDGSVKMNLANPDTQQKILEGINSIKNIELRPSSRTHAFRTRRSGT